MSNSGSQDIELLRAKQDIRALIQLLIDGDWRICQDAADALIKIGVPAAEPLIVALDDIPQDTITEILIKIGRRPNSKSLLESLKTNNPIVQKAFSKAFDDWKDLFIPTLNDSVEKRQQVFSICLERLKEEARRAIIGAVMSYGKFNAMHRTFVIKMITDNTRGNVKEEAKEHILRYIRKGGLNEPEFPWEKLDEAQVMVNRWTTEYDPQAHPELAVAEIRKAAKEYFGINTVAWESDRRLGQ